MLLEGGIMKSGHIKAWTVVLAVFTSLVLVGSLYAQGASLSFRTGETPTGPWYPILDGNGDPILAGCFIGLYLTGPDGEVDPPSEEEETCGEPTGDDVRATENFIGNGLDHLEMGFNEPPFVPEGNMFTGNGLVQLPDPGAGIEPVINIEDRFYLRAFNSDSVHTATHYNNLLWVNGDTVDSYVHEATGPAVILLGFTEALPLDCGGTPVGPDGIPNVAAEYRLYQNYPNPFNPVTTINYDVKSRGYVTLKVYNLLGQVSMVLVDGWSDTGQYSVTLNAADLPSGIYFYELKVNGFRDVKKMVLMK
jgi:hypothetical protein